MAWPFSLDPDKGLSLCRSMILVGQSELLHQLSLKVNEDIASRLTYSTTLKRLTSDDIRDFVSKQLDDAGLGHNVFSDDAINLIIRSSEGTLRKVRNLCLSSMVEAVRGAKRVIDIDIVNSVLIQLYHFGSKAGTQNY